MQLLIKTFPYHDAKYCGQVETRIKDADWTTDVAEERKELILFLIDCIEKIENDYDTGKLNFNSIDDGLHEFRRKLRWLSIYAAVSDGQVQLKKIKHASEDLKKYLTDEIVKLPYNQLPSAKKGVMPIYIESPNFYALSWLIQELGNLKDMGLKWKVIDEATVNAKQTENADALSKSLKKLIPHSPEEILEIAQNLTDDFIHKHHMLTRIKRDLRRAKDIGH